MGPAPAGAGRGVGPRDRYVTQDGQNGRDGRVNESIEQVPQRELCPPGRSKVAARNL